MGVKEGMVSRKKGHQGRKGVRKEGHQERVTVMAGHAHGRERKSGMGVTFLLSHCRKGVEWCVNRREIVGLVGIAELD